MTGPLLFTTARWHNVRRSVRGFHGEWTERWSKVLAHTGHYDQFAYGQDHPSTWRYRDLQVAIICSRWSRVIGVDVDYETEFKTTRTGQLIGRQHAIDTRGERYHALIDARDVPEDRWPPKQLSIAGADVKSCGFIPMPGSIHYSGEPYQPVPGARVIPATPELIEAILADQLDLKGKRRSHGHGGSGGGHDGEVAASVLSSVLRGMSKEQCYAEWARVAVALDPAWPYDWRDFERHHGSALRRAAEIRAAEAEAYDGISRWVTAVQGGN